MTRIKILFFFTILFLAVVSIQAQESVNPCYEIGMSESRAMFNEAQRLQSLGKEEEAAQMFLAAFNKAQETEEKCKDKSTDGDEQKTKTSKRSSSQGIGRQNVSPVDRRPSFYLDISAGVSRFGTVSFGDMDKRSATVFGADVTYYFNSWLGAGIKLNMANCNVDFGDTGSYHDHITFIGPGMYGRWAKERIEFLAGASAGSLKWKLSDVEIKNISGTNQSAASTSAFLWTGVNFLLTKNIGVALKVQSALGTVKTSEGLERNPAGASVAVGVNCRF